nr:hypothetical protein B0A51_07245 [Rachicladosporium sp. CCFEE 5018]
MPEYYCFGIELEMVATPRNDSQATRFMREAGRDNLKYHLKYYDELATAMRLEGLEAIAVPRSRAPPRGWRGWHITSDGSILEDEDGEVLQPPIGMIPSSPL